MAIGRRQDLVADFALREHRSVLESLEWILDAEVRWPIRPSRVRVASLKCLQLVVAQRLGLSVPPTIVTNDPASADAFRESVAHAGADVVYKPLTWYVAPPDQFLYTSIVTGDDIQDSPTSIAAAPCQFQQYIDKRYELRVTVVGDRIFPVRVNSQARADSKIDWRRGQNDLEYTDWEISSDLAARLRAYLHAFGLEYGAFDLIVSPEDTCTFLECNPMGQWLWIEDLTDADISASIASLLVGGRDEQTTSG